MPPLPGEERVLTLFADVHYYFSAPTPRPGHDRFDKGSYLYIYHNPAQQRARIEIANNPGLPVQDAFFGSLGSIHLRTSDKFPTLYTLTVDGYRQNIPGSTVTDNSDPNDWQLPSVNPRDGSQNLSRLHTLDLYFWTLSDAQQFLDAARRVLAPGQVDLIGNPPSAAQQEAAISPVVQQLENIAISDPAYRNGQTRNSATQPSSAQTHAPQLNTALSPPLPGPPLSTPSQPVSPLEEPKVHAPPKPQESQQVDYTPLAYNPAAPAAPEPIKPREKTPPPPDAASGTGLTAAASGQYGQTFAPPPPPPMTGGIVPPPPGQPQGYGSPPPHNSRLSLSGSVSSQGVGHNPSGSLSFTPPPPGQPSVSGPPAPQTAAQYAASPGQPNIPTPPAPQGTMQFAPPPQDPNNPAYQQQQQQQQSFAPPPTQTPHQPAAQPPQQSSYQYQPQQQQQQQQQPPYGQPQYNPTLHPQQAQQPQQPAVPIGGYSNYSYGQPQQQSQQGGEYNVHSQVYRPTEAETAIPFAKKQRANDAKMGIEKSVGKFWKKIEKKL
ncbi:hypothetical protein AJ80_06148 [Polytolypa hystricis UAMH7299]|uniref:Uncharacterized protein n=1 Tax=Polytolypa hystricis (strain UAMH7299) TaxID=1447883 RepID=A0A2B7XY79_POLH7|nr:hypothetical protein AJ80_06148 [Polytolypa hystricis UAMH7299]